MDLQDLVGGKIISQSISLGTSNDPRELGKTLNTVRKGILFRYMAIIRGEESSVRLFSTRPIPEIPTSYTMGLMCDGDELAAELIKYIENPRFAEQARFPAQTKPDSVKGWELQYAMINGRPIVIAIATWVEVDKPVAV